MLPAERLEPTRWLPSPEPVTRALGDAVWGRKLARLPREGTLLVCTDLHGNLDDYQRMKAVYFREKQAGNQPILALCGDLVHGPNPALSARWPSYLGSPYRDRSAELLLDFEQFTRTERAFTLLGNHEHAHIGGPKVPKFYPDEAAVLDAALGVEAERMHDFMRSFPLLAAAPCGVVLTHGAPRATEPSVSAFERLHYEGYEHIPLLRMADVNTVGALLWARMASETQAVGLLRTVLDDGAEGGFVAFGHDVVPAGFDRFTDSQICVSTSFGLDNRNKVYLRLDLSRRYRSAQELQVGEEILPLLH